MEFLQMRWYVNDLYPYHHFKIHSNHLIMINEYAFFYYYFRDLEKLYKPSHYLVICMNLEE